MLKIIGHPKGANEARKRLAKITTNIISVRNETHYAANLEDRQVQELISQGCTVINPTFMDDPSGTISKRLSIRI